MFVVPGQEEVSMEHDAGALAGLAALSFIWIMFCLAVAVIAIASLWKVFTKAGKPGWASIVPIYNIIILLEITGKPIWWIFLYLIPLVNIVVAIIVMIELARRFGKSDGFGIGLALLGAIFLPILAFGNAQYQPRAA